MKLPIYVYPHPHHWKAQWYIVSGLAVFGLQHDILEWYHNQGQILKLFAGIIAI